MVCHSRRNRPADQHWMDLCSVMGDITWVNDESFRTMKGRLRNDDELDKQLSEWTINKSPQEMMGILQSVGVPSGVVQQSSDLMHDPHLAHRDFFSYFEHPELGKVPYTGHQFKINGYANGPLVPPPLFGEHNDLILREFLEMSDDEITEVAISGALI